MSEYFLKQLFCSFVADCSESVVVDVIVGMDPTVTLGFVLVSIPGVFLPGETHQEHISFSLRMWQ